MAERFKEDGEGPKHAVDDMGRRVWDKNAFTPSADGIFDEDDDTFINAAGKRDVIPMPASERKLLEARRVDLNLAKDVGKFKVVTEQTAKQFQGGYWCSVCECLLKDSHAYLDHINGRRHNRNMGMTMQVKKSTADEVAERIKMNLQAAKEARLQVTNADVELQLLAAQEKEEEKKQKRKEKKRKRNGGDDPEAKKAKGEAEEEEEDEETKMLRAMGLPTGFG
mmetsp:Transcript_5954/g.14173  ORF Transcript_5954/g.14173 Transcript_5954/m.14173 type:complete len:223 (+) Transcript_5954:41-709(+)